MALTWASATCSESDVQDKKIKIRVWVLAALLMMSSVSWARGTYQEPDSFISEVFAGKPPVPKQLWITDALQRDITLILGHPLGQRRIRYWRDDIRSAWILDEIGKEEPITIGYVVHKGRIERVRVLVYRESRGDEVRYPRFTEQFKGATLKNENALDRSIDNISGATMSVDAMTRTARLALYLDKKSQE